MNNSRIIQLKKFLEESPDDPFIHYGLALEFQKSDTAEALKKYDELLQKFPDYLPTYYHAAHLFWESELHEKAEEIFFRGIALAEKQGDQNTLRELRNAYQNFQFES